MTSIVDLVAPSGVGEFLDTTWGRQARVYPGRPDRFAHLMPWDGLNEILRRQRLAEPRLRLARSGERVPVEEYTTTVTPRRGAPYRRIDHGALGTCLRDGATLVLDSADELYAPVDELAADLERTLRERTQVNLYASFNATRGFETHWDDHDVLVVQVHGRKHWRIFGPTRRYPSRRDVETPQPPSGEPELDFVLTEGDVLHVPRGWWHDASATEGASLHLTFGVNSCTGADFVAWLADQLRYHEAARADLPRHAGPEARRARVTELADLLAKELAEPGVLDRFLSDRDAMAPPRTWSGLPFSVHDTVPADTGAAVTFQAPRAVLAEDDAAGTVSLAAGGDRLTFAAPAAPVLRALVGGGTHTVGDLVEIAGGLDPETVATLCTQLVRNGLATVA